MIGRSQVRAENSSSALQRDLERAVTDRTHRNLRCAAHHPFAHRSPLSPRWIPPRCPSSTAIAVVAVAAVGGGSEQREQQKAGVTSRKLTFRSEQQQPHGKTDSDRLLLACTLTRLGSDPPLLIALLLACRCLVNVHRWKWMIIRPVPLCQPLVQAAALDLDHGRGRRAVGDDRSAAAEEEAVARAATADDSPRRCSLRGTACLRCLEQAQRADASKRRHRRSNKSTRSIHTAPFQTQDAVATLRTASA